MNYYPLDYTNIEWEKKSTLYRGTNQALFGKTILMNTLEDEKSSYWGCNDKESEKITFCSSCYFDALFHARNRANDKKECYERKELSLGLFSYFPLIMKINASHYKDHLYTTKGEGIVIKGPVELEDINIIYSLHIDNLDKECPYSEEKKESANQLIYRHEPSWRIFFSDRDIIDAYENNSHQILNRFGIHNERLLKTFFDVMKRTLRQKETIP